MFAENWMFAHINLKAKSNRHTLISKVNQTAERKLNTMSYYTVKEIAQMWGVTVQTVRRYCSEGKIHGAIQTIHGWQVPESANRPDREVVVPDRPLPLLANRLFFGVT